jgi:RNA polymerase sigma-70 factor (ECF subfamily)
MPDPPSDAEVIVASRSDPARFAEVFDRHFRTIHRYLLRRVGRELADDLAAETFAQAFVGRDRYDPTRADAKPWLFGIAANLLRHHKRRERRQLLAYSRTGVDPVVDPELDRVEACLDAEAAGPLIARALGTLRQAEREVLLLYAWADLSYAEISEALGLPPGTVRSRLSRARRRIRELIEADGQDEEESDVVLQRRRSTQDG